jgi:hypothetical protein
MKICTKCKEEKPLDQFYKQGDGLMSRCSTCCKEIKKRWMSNKVYVDPPQEKPCNTCGITKPISEFNKDRQAKTGIRAKCRECQRGEPKRRYKYKNTHFSQEQYNIKLIEQDGVCAICGKEEEGKTNRGDNKKLAVDHNHKNGQVRGLLCSRCNTAIGLLREDVTAIGAAIKYIIKHNGGTYE